MTCFCSKVTKCDSRSHTLLPKLSPFYSQLKAEIQAIRMKSVLRAGDDLSKMCARCHAELGRFFNRGDLCPKCRFRVCNMCKENLLMGKWLCVLCYKQRYSQHYIMDRRCFSRYILDRFFRLLGKW